MLQPKGECEGDGQIALATKNMKFVIKDGCLISLPVYEPHKNGKNWLAIITLTGGGKGDRKFIDKAQDSVLKYPIHELKVGQMLEFGADMIHGKDNRVPRRWYGVIQSITDTAMEAQEYKTVEAMLAEHGKKPASANSEPPKPLQEKPRAGDKEQKSREVLLSEKKMLLLRLGEIEFELHKMA